MVANVYRVLELPSLSDKDCYFDPGCIIFHFPNHMINPTGIRIVTVEEEVFIDLYVEL